MFAELSAGKILLINKPFRWTSFDVVNKIKYSLRSLTPKDYPKKRGMKVGHTGTLDPLATGLLIICTGTETKNIDSYVEDEKEYTGSFTLGATTASGDLEQPISENFPTEHITEEMILKAAKKFTGEQLQTPPIYSAVKIDGRRAYKSARRGKEIVMRRKLIDISVFEITSVKMPIVYFRVVCSKGTYIRSLALDFGKELGSGAHLSSLCRTRVGKYKLEDAMEMSVLEKKLLDEKHKTMSKLST